MGNKERQEFPVMTGSEELDLSLNPPQSVDINDADENFECNVNIEEVPNDPWFKEHPDSLAPVSLLPFVDNNPPIHEPSASFSRHENLVDSLPVVLHVASTRLPDDKESIKVELLANMLDRKLNGTQEWGVGFVERIFSDKVLGIEVSSLSKNNHTMA